MLQSTFNIEVWCSAGQRRDHDDYILSASFLSAFYTDLNSLKIETIKQYFNSTIIETRPNGSTRSEDHTQRTILRKIMKGGQQMRDCKRWLEIVRDFQRLLEIARDCQRLLEMSNLLNTVQSFEYGLRIQQTRWVLLKFY